jgi:hypothetical protein
MPMVVGMVTFDYLRSVSDFPFAAICQRPDWPLLFDLRIARVTH